MAYEQKANARSLFKVDEKESDRHPDYTGKVMVGGTEYRLAGWMRESKNGKRYLSLSFSVPEASRVSKERVSHEVGHKDDIPW